MTVFSTIDLESAYFQLPLHEESRDLTEFIPYEGHFRFCRVLFGLASAPSAFKKMVVTVLRGLPNVANYLDDIIIWGSTQTEHNHTAQSRCSALTGHWVEVEPTEVPIQQNQSAIPGTYSECARNST